MLTFCEIWILDADSGCGLSFKHQYNWQTIGWIFFKSLCKLVPMKEWRMRIRRNLEAQTVARKWLIKIIILTVFSYREKQRFFVFSLDPSLYVDGLNPNLYVLISLIKCLTNFIFQRFISSIANANWWFEPVFSLILQGASPVLRISYEVYHRIWFQKPSSTRVRVININISYRLRRREKLLLLKLTLSSCLSGAWCALTLICRMLTSTNAPPTAGLLEPIDAIWPRCRWVRPTRRSDRRTGNRLSLGKAPNLHMSWWIDGDPMLL